MKRPETCKHCGGSGEFECFQNAWGEHGSDCPWCDGPADLGEWVDYANYLEEKIKKLERVKDAAYAIFNENGNTYEEPEHIAEMKASLKDMEPTMQERLENLK